ncbi:uncharacterized protein BJ212DRAFT_1484048 [Suillus subaureus]|uniref:Uncharacterized protein n=1 Tax=Suillus subaureus TaxID=48587 RepID=A0A9P7E4E4_9AGAM|nr:uncharacterized protein BJ212DRAFT_1484048 [Suillus subaureus]KAG1810922.1 hypothetical protein BJ212DRAFT_1484048 [Suillus subaureus]
MRAEYFCMPNTNRTRPAPRRCHDQFVDVNELSSRIFEGTEAEVHATRGAHPQSSVTTELPQPPTTWELHPRLLLLSIVRRSPPENNGANDFPQLPVLSRLHLQVLLRHLFSLLFRSQPNFNGVTEP